VERAKGLGADPGILGKVEVLESMEPSPLYESAVSPASAQYNAYSWGPWGGWDPLDLDPWSYVQRAAD
jgi:hypothetical protein